MKNPELDGLDAVVSLQAGKLCGLLTEEVLSRVPQYTLQPNDLQYAEIWRIPGNIVIRPNSLMITLQPVK